MTKVLIKEYENFLAKEYEKFSKQIILKKFGIIGQKNKIF